MAENRKNKARICFILAAVAAILSVLLTLLILKVDVEPIGPDESRVGLSSLNAAVAARLAYDGTAHTLSEIFGYGALLVMAAYFCKGVWQLIKRRSVKKVDKHIILLGIFYAVLLVVYLGFDFIPINYRPLILDPEKGLEPSFPSSHTVLALCVYLTLPLQPEFTRPGREKLKIAVLSASVLLAVLTVGTRFISGVHWVTDVIGGVIISACLVALYGGAFLLTVPASDSLTGKNEQ